MVVSPIEGSPAWRAGIEPGDVIKKIDGSDTDCLEWDDAVTRIQGPAGSEVVLVVERRGKELTFRIKRERFEVKHGRGAAARGRLRLRQDPHLFLQHRRQAARGAGRPEEEEPSQGGLRGLMLDLRRNPGGLLDQGVRVADRFLSEGMIVRTVGKGGREMDRQMAHARGTWTDFPMVVLVDEATASAAEIVAGALQDHQRAVIMGTQTFGKGSVQTVMEIDGCGAKPCGLKLTVSRYYTPSGRSIQNQGITPDVLVDARPRRPRVPPTTSCARRTTSATCATTRATRPRRANA